jgi:serine/threonine-protein kinase
MELIEGAPLYDWAREQRPSSRQVLQVLARLARALEATHAVGGLHRDVKGDNMRVRRADGQPFLMDFGSGHHLGAATLTAQPFPPGTPTYRAPEAWRYVLRDRRPPAVPYAPGPGDDVFALGVTAYRLITGKYPPSAHPDDEDAWLWRTEARSAWLPRAFNVRCAEELSAQVSQMLSSAPKARGSARDVAEALEQAAQKAGPEADAPLFTGEEPRPAGLFPAPQRVSLRRPPRAAWRSWSTAARLGGALALSAGALLSALSVEAPATGQLAEEDASKDAGTVAVGDSALTTPEAPEEAPSVWSAISVDLPPKPLPGQRRPDAKGRCPSKLQVAINGGCWRKQPITDMKDCDDDAYVYRGACYVPTYAPPPRATSSPTQRADGG